MTSAEAVEGTARVIAVGQGQVVLEAERRAACGGCGESSHCGVAALTKWKKADTVRFTLTDTFQARVGERVVIGIDAGSVARASLIAYGLPLIGALVGAMVGGSYGGDALALPLCLMGGVLGYGLARRSSPHLAKPFFLRRGA
ncbi:MAG: SoxR reducing system RseC family protein [Magnetospiraceae bacterium]